MGTARGGIRACRSNRATYRAVRGLRWQDIASDPPAITWRKEFDKRRRQQTIPIPQTVADEIRALRAQLGAFGDDWLFRQTVRDEPWHRKRFDALLRRAERKAKVAKLDGGLWHCYRRKWATERRHLPAVDVMKAGGWTDRKTMETCYQHADDAGVLAVMGSTTKLRERNLEVQGRKRRHSIQERRSPARVNACGTCDWGGWIRTTDLLIHRQASWASLTINLLAFIGRSGVGAGVSQHRCRKMPGETSPETAPRRSQPTLIHYLDAKLAEPSEQRVWRLQQIVSRSTGDGESSPA